MRITYSFELDKGERSRFDIDTERYSQKTQDTQRPKVPEKWTELGYCQCPNCPLKVSEHPHCPAALDLQRVIETFARENAYQKVKVRVETPQRIFEKHCSVEEGLRSMMGLVMATSGCPVLGEMKPLASNHVPFSNNDEFVMRSVSLYLMQQYFRLRDHKAPDWELKGLVERSKRLQAVNQALWQRIHVVCEGDSSLKALLSFFSLASSITFSLEAQLGKLRKSIDGGSANDAPAPF